jgi:hypothetical protein
MEVMLKTSSILECYVVWTRKQLPTFRAKVVLSPSDLLGLLHHDKLQSSDTSGSIYQPTHHNAPEAAIQTTNYTISTSTACALYCRTKLLVVMQTQMTQVQQQKLATDPCTKILSIQTRSFSNTTSTSLQYFPYVNFCITIECEICALRGCYAASIGNPLPTFRDNLSVPSLFILGLRDT